MTDPTPGAPPDGEVRWPLLAKVGVALAVLTVVGGIVAALAAALVVDGDDPVAVATDDPVAPILLPDGRVAWAERTTGRVLAVDPDDPASVAVLAEVPDALDVDGQRGLLGLAAAQDDGTLELHATWTRASDGRLVVGRLLPAERAGLVWEGPVSSDLANGGTLAHLGDGLVLGVGELREPELADDPTAPNGKVLLLDPDGPADQVPEVLAGGWHNPFALTVADGDVWLVDNAPGRAPERLARIGRDGGVDVVDLPGRRAPSGLAATDDGLLLCTFLDRVVVRIPRPDVGVSAELAPTDLTCGTGVVGLADGRVATTVLDEPRLLILTP